MFLIDHPYVSEFLIETLKKNAYPIIRTEASQKLLSNAPVAWVSKEDTIKRWQNDPNQRMISNSENALEWILDHLKGSDLSEQIGVLKDKHSFRERLQRLHPTFTFQKVAFKDLPTIPVSELLFPVVIKPSVGFLSIGVEVVENETDWVKAIKRLMSNTQKSIFPKSVLDTSHYILEDCIEGEEFAIDFYYDHSGAVVILSIFHHIFSDGKDTSDRVYSTSREIVMANKTRLETYLNQMGELLQLKNFPAHAEVRIDENGAIIPIEINPLRFGGWCTTADVMGVGLGLNLYEYFIENKQPDWKEVFRDREDKLYSLVVLDNNSGIKASDIHSFDYEALTEKFENPFMIRKLDIHHFPLFGFVFLETSKSNQQELFQILNDDLRSYISKL